MTETSRLQSFLLAFIAVCSIWAVYAASTPPAEAADASNKTIIYFGGDRMYNYDFLSRNQYYGQSRNVDWAVTMIWYNNAEVDKVKNWYWDTWSCGGSKYGRFYDYGGYEWDSDAGAKSRCTLLGDVYHMRVYGDEDDRMYSTQYGYWVYATTHVDHNENLWGEWFGASERSETYWREWARDVRGWTVYSPGWDMNNNEPYRAQGNHRWENDRYATTVAVP